MRPTSLFPTLVFVVIVAIGVALAYAIYGVVASWGKYWLIVAALIVAAIVAAAIKVADQWERVVVLRLGRFRALEGPACSSSFRSSRPSPTGSTPA